MSNNTDSQPCPKCGTQIPADAPQGLCPKCLLQQASIPTDSGKGGKPIPPTVDELSAAFPQLEILELIGQGGMGFVFKARQKKIDRVVALKILPESLASDPAFAERFTREGRVLARLNHPNIVMIHDFGQANGFFYLLMEFVDGVNLREAMKAGRFTADQALAVVPKICEALQFAHDEGILHRDIKPENILLDSKGRIKIADFGIAKLVGEPHGETNLTVGGSTLGTPHYMAPEQLERPGEVDHRADIYSLGVVFYEMLTGELPIGKFQPPSRKVNVDVRLDDVVLQALEKEPERRYQQVSQVKTQVDTIACNPPSATPPRVPSPVIPAPPKDLFWRRLVVVLLICAAGIILLPICALILAIVIPKFKKPHSAPPSPPHAVSPPMNPTPTMSSPKTTGEQLVLDFISTPEVSGDKTYWHWKGLLPPRHTAQVFFVRWREGFPAIDQALSGYLKVGRDASDVDFFISFEKHDLKSDQPWAAQWNVNLGMGRTVSAESSNDLPALQARVPFRTVVASGQQAAIPLLDYQTSDGSDTRRNGVELRIVLQPSSELLVRTFPSEEHFGRFLAGPGLLGSMDDALTLIREVPTEPNTFPNTKNNKMSVTLLSVEDHSSDGFVMWRPDGSPVEATVQAALTNFWPRSSAGVLWYSLLVSNAPSTAFEEFWKGKFEARTGQGSITPFSGRIEASPVLGGTLIRFADFGIRESKIANIRLGVVQRPAKTLLKWEGIPLKLIQSHWTETNDIDIDLDSFPSKRINDFDPRKGFVTTSNAGSAIRITVPRSPERTDYWIVEVTDQAGEKHLVRNCRTQLSNYNESMEYALCEVGVVPSEIRSIQLKGHLSQEDYHWAEFKKVLLDPLPTNSEAGNTNN